MDESRPPLSIEAQTAVSMTAAAFIAVALGVGMFLAGGGTPVLVTSLVIAAVTGIFALTSWKQALRGGWRTRRDEDGGDDSSGGGGSDEPAKPLGPTGGIRIDWDEFTSDFWDHVRAGDRSRSRERVPV